MGWAIYDALVTVDAEKILHDALILPPSDRAELVAELLASLDSFEEDVGLGC